MDQNINDMYRSFGHLCGQKFSEGAKHANSPVRMNIETSQQSFEVAAKTASCEKRLVIKFPEIDLLRAGQKVIE